MAQTKIQSVQLSDSGVVPGPYTNANVTVDSAGRITVIANGSSGTPALTSTQVAYGSLSNLITSTADFTYDDTTGTLEVGPTGSPALVTANTGQSITVEGDTGAQLKSGVNTFGINSSGAVLANASAGTVGQVLTSSGAAAAPTWTTVGGGTSAPLNQLVYGTGPGTSSSPDFTFNSTTGELNVNQTLGYSLTPGNVTIGASSSDGTGNIAGGDVSIYSGSASGFQTPGKILLETGTSVDNASRAKLLLTRPISSNHASSIEMYAARGNTSADGGYVSIRGGRAGGDIGTLGGVVEIYAGDGYLSGAGGSIRFSTQVGLVLEILNTGDLQVGGSSGTSGQVLTSSGVGVPPVWSSPAGGGLEMNVFLLNNGSGSFDGSLIGNWSSVQQRDENATLTWSPDPYGAAFTCQVNGVYEIVVECRIIGNDGSSRWPDDLSAYGVDLLADSPALNTTPRTKLHTRYSTAGLSTGNLGLQVGPASPVNEAANTSSFTERYIVRSDPGGIVYPRLFAYSYNSTGASASFSMSISFMKISAYTPA